MLELPEKIISKILEFTCESDKSSYENLASTCKLVREISRGPQFVGYFKCQDCVTIWDSLRNDHLICYRWHFNKKKKYEIDQLCVDASAFGSLSVVEYLVSLGANIHEDDDDAVRRAPSRGHLEVVKYLVSLGANIRAHDDSAMLWASASGHLEVVKYLVSLGANIHTNNDKPLIMASAKGHFFVVKYLVSLGANIHAQKDYALRHASAYGRLEVVKYLVLSGANIHAIDYNYILDVGSRHRAEVIKYLVSLRANIDSIGRNCLLRMGSCDPEIIKCLVSMGVYDDVMRSSSKKSRRELAKYLVSLDIIRDRCSQNPSDR